MKKALARHESLPAGPAGEAEPALSELLEQARAAKEHARMQEGLALAQRAWDKLDPAEQGAGGEPCGDLGAEVGSLVVFFSLRSGRNSQAQAFGRDLLRVLTSPAHSALRTELLRWLVGASLELADFESALGFAIESCDLAETQGDAGERSKSCGALANCYASLGDHEQAERLTLDALALAEQGPPGLTRLAPLNNLCAISINAFFQHREAGDHQGAQSALERSLSYALRLKDGIAQMESPAPILGAYATSNLGEALLHLGKDTEAAHWLQDNLRVAQSLGLTGIVWRMRYLLGEVSLRRGQPEQAQELLQQVLQADGSEVGMPTLERTHLAMHRCCKEMGDLARALEHLEKARLMGMQRTQAQLTVQSRLFVTRLEADRAKQVAERAHAEARRQEALAQAYSEAAMTDPLTGLHNRRHLETQVPPQLEAAQEARRPVSLAMLDLDHFKSVNDRFGHTVGDQVLVSLAALLRERMRSGDHLVRMGGEEILVLLSGAAPALAQEICERLREAVERHDWQTIHPELRVTISIGLASSPSHELQSLIDRADTALYAAKQAGRNRVTVAAASLRQVSG